MVKIIYKTIYNNNNSENEIIIHLLRIDLCDVIQLLLLC